MGKARFVNRYVKNLRRSFYDAVLWKLGVYKDALPRSIPPEGFVYPASFDNFSMKDPKAIWIGHSTYLLEIGGVNILTDPIWDDYCSPIPIRALKRKTLPPIALEDLPPIDIVLISHNHYDHLDAKTVGVLKRFHPQIQWVVPEGLVPWFHKRRIFNVIELSWWKSKTLLDAKITAVPAQHFSGRGLFDMNKTHWNGYVVELKGKRVYFTGDTGYNPIDFKEIGANFSSMDLGLIPIGTYSPKRFMAPVHIDPYEAVKIHKDVGSKFSLGMHWNTFRLSEEPINRPPYDLYLAMKEQNLPFETFLPGEIGAYVNF